MCAFGKGRGGSGRGGEPGLPPGVRKEGTRTHTQRPTSGPSSLAVRPGKGEAKSGQSELLNRSSVEFCCERKAFGGRREMLLGAATLGKELGK